jgi:hypothetical protein
MLLGASDGMLDGCPLGASDGMLLGCDDGSDVGDVVGDVVGNFVGKLVGAGAVALTVVGSSCRVPTNTAAVISGNDRKG